MIVPHMNFDEIQKELLADIPFAFEASDRKDNKVKRIIQKSTKFPVYIHSYITSQRKNRWLLMWESRSKKEKGDDARFTMACIVNQGNGRMVFMPSWINGELYTIVFLPHFFSRFAERIELELTGEELIRRFLQHNPNFSFEVKKEQVNEAQYRIVATGTCEEGVALGFMLKGNAFFFKTFIRFDMAKGNQTSMFEALEEIRKDHSNPF